MNLQALQEIIDNHVGILESSARDKGADEKAVVGIANYTIIHGFDALSKKQKYYFDNCIRHLIQGVQCPGYNHEFEESRRECLSVLDDDDLVEYYQNDGKLCESCEGEAASDVHSKESFFRD